MKRILFNNKGSAVIFIAISFVVLLGFTALVTDIGMMVHRKSKLQVAVDAAALAGAYEIPKHTTKAKEVALQYAALNGAKKENVSVSFEESDNVIVVTATEKVNLFFAKVLGIKEGNVSVLAAATNETGKGLRPFGVDKKTYLEALNEEEDEDEEDGWVVLKVGVGNSHSGNFHALQLDDPGAKDYKNIILTGSETAYQIGDYVKTETGNMVGPTKDAIKDLIKLCEDTSTIDGGCTQEHYTNYVDSNGNVHKCPRVVAVPIIESMEVNGKDEVLIINFAEFFVESIRSKGGYTEVLGIFLGTIDLNSSTFRNVRLTR